MQIIDTHAHFWDVERLDYPWITQGSPFYRRFVPDDYWQAAAGVPIGQIVFVECDASARHSVAEAEWVTALASAEPRIAAIVARVALTDADAMAKLDAVGALPLVRGIRDNIQGHAPGFALQEDFVRGVQAVHGRGLHFELCVTHDQLDEAIDLVRRCPQGRFVLDHCGKPAIARGLREPWSAQIRTMAGLPNVDCKISGLAMEAGSGWQPADLLDYARVAADAFGPDRILFGSDWPLVTMAGGYGRWFDVAQALAAPWSARDRALFFCGNAARVYRLT